MFRHGVEQIIKCAIDSKASRRKPKLYVENLRSRLICPGETRKVSKKQYKPPTNPKGSEFTYGQKFGTKGELPRGISTVPRGLCARVRLYTIIHNTTHYSTIPHTTTQYSKLLHNTTRYYTLHHNTTQFNTILHSSAQ